MQGISNFSPPVAARSLPTTARPPAFSFPPAQNLTGARIKGYRRECFRTGEKQADSIAPEFVLDLTRGLTCQGLPPPTKPRPPTPNRWIMPCRRGLNPRTYRIPVAV